MAPPLRSRVSGRILVPPFEMAVVATAVLKILRGTSPGAVHPAPAGDSIPNRPTLFAPACRAPAFGNGPAPAELADAPALRIFVMGTGPFIAPMFRRLLASRHRIVPRSLRTPRSRPLGEKGRPFASREPRICGIRRSIWPTWVFRALGLKLLA